MQGLPDLFDRFINNISLGEPQVSRMTSAASAIATFLVTKLNLANGQVFLQGSYPNGTAVEPVLGGEYDVDIVCVGADASTTADEALNELERLFKSDGRFANRVQSKKPCVRLEYAGDQVGSFHVDVVPVRPGITAPLEAPRKGEGWHDTAPAEYTNWCTQQGESFARSVKVFKRWRDEQQPVRNAIKSIVLQVLVSQYMPLDIDDDASRITTTFRQMHDALRNLDTPPQVINPVLPSEDLARRWTTESFRSFVRELEEAVEITKAALTADNSVEAADHWRSLLGEDFPSQTPDTLGLKLGDYSHAQSFAVKGWQEALDQRYGVRVSLRLERGRAHKHQSRQVDENHLIFAGTNLHFRAHVTSPNHVEVWWQVANTGEHARLDSSLRGEIFRGKDLKGNELANQEENWESSRYTGVHLIRAVLVRDRRVVAYSEWRKVPIVGRGHRFAV